MAYRLISLLAIATPALALSSHSPIDLEAYPAYTISLNQENPVLNETLNDLLHETLEAPPNSLPEKRHFLRTPSGQGFLCTVPSVTIASKKRAQAQAELDESSRQLQRQKGLERGLALLEPMRGGCIYMKQNWFTYSFCYGSEIRQFHEVRVAGSPAPKEDPNAEAYVLGHAPEPSIYNSNPKYGSGSHEVAKKEAWIPSRLGGVEGMGLDESGRYLSQVWEGGTVCDKTGMPRSVEVQFHCNTQTIDRIALIRETSICRYVLLIHTPRLCAEPLFLEGADKSLEPPSNIECQPVVSKFHESISHGDPSTASIESHDGGEGLNEPMPLQNLVIQPPAQAQGVDSSLPTDDQHSASTLSTDSVEQDHIETALLMTYNSETGEIESVESTILDLVEKGKQDQQELRRRVFGNGQDETLQREGQGNAEGQEGPKATITVDQLEEMVKMMADSLANAMKDATRQGERSDSRESAQDSEASNPSNRDQVVSILKELWGQDTAAQLGVEQQARGDEGNLIKNLLKKTRGNNKNEAFEQMKRGFGRRYDLADDEDEDNPRRPRDEL